MKKDYNTALWHTCRGELKFALLR
jgi:hypothetical protein